MVAYLNEQRCGTARAGLIVVIEIRGKAMDVAGVDKDDIARRVHVGSVIDLEDAFAVEGKQNLEVIMKMVLNELDLVDEHLDVLDLGIFDYLNT